MKKLNKLAKEGNINLDAVVRDEHSMIVNAPVKLIWKVLKNYQEWDTWNSQIKNVVFEGDFEEGAQFSWVFDNTKFKSEIQTIEKHKLISWTGKSSLLKRVVIWQLDADKESKSTIVTLKTSLEGIFAMLTHKNQRVYKELVFWLEALNEEVLKQLLRAEDNN